MKISSIRALEKIADKIKKKLSPGDVVFQYGEIGVGKTTFARLLINNFENEKKLKKSEVLSPTFNIVFEYEIKEFTIKHFDLYRLKNDNDVKNIGLYEDLEQSITLIEWPELIKNKPQNRLDLFFEYEEDYNERSLIIKSNGRLKIFCYSPLHIQKINQDDFVVYF
jgi:tRNA threonylcarbamoyl adenosine modification protein YjeE